MKKCPYCAEDIQDTAIKCKHCGEFLDETKRNIVSKNIETKKEDIVYEYKTIKVYAGLNDYLHYLPFFGWEIIGNQKVNYSSDSSSNNSGRVGFFDNKSYSGKENTNTTYHYYNELSLKRIKGKLEKDNKELFNIEGEFFTHINNIHNYIQSYGYISFLIYGSIAFFVFSLFQRITFEEFLITYFILILIIGFITDYNVNNNIRKRRKNTMPELNKKYKDIFIKYNLIK